jgi:hypothetical protein
LTKASKAGSHQAGFEAFIRLKLSHCILGTILAVLKPVEENMDLVGAGSRRFPFNFTNFQAPQTDFYLML